VVGVPGQHDESICSCLRRALYGNTTRFSSIRVRGYNLTQHLMVDANQRIRNTWKEGTHEKMLSIANEDPGSSTGPEHFHGWLCRSLATFVSNCANDDRSPLRPVWRMERPAGTQHHWTLDGRTYRGSILVCNTREQCVVGYYLPSYGSWKRPAV